MKYKVIGEICICHSGKKFPTGSVIDLQESEAKRLSVYLESYTPEKPDKNSSKKDKAVDSGDEPNIETNNENKEENK